VYDAQRYQYSEAYAAYERRAKERADKAMA
jgi:hypothetical protein